jgi:hypothetical protein
MQCSDDSFHGNDTQYEQDNQHDDDDYDDEDESGSDDERALAFDVAGEQPPSSRPPSTAEEYLRQVRYQARRCPDVVVATNEPPRKAPSTTTTTKTRSQLLRGFQSTTTSSTSGSSSNNNTTAAPLITANECNAHLIPSTAWVASFIHTFEATRQVLYHHCKAMLGNSR